MAYEFIIYEIKDNVATITLNRPEKLNAMHDALRTEWWNAIKEAGVDDNVKVIIIKGAGRAFSAGHDLGLVGSYYGFKLGKDAGKERRPSERIRLYRDRRLFWTEYMDLLYSWKPTIAQIHGHCHGGACFLQLCCDISIAAEDAEISVKDQRLGFAGSSAPIPLLVYHVGPKIMREMVLTGRSFTGKEAQEVGLINRAVPADKLDEEVNKVARAICLQPRDGVAIGKAVTHWAYDSMGLSNQFMQMTIGHTLFTNLRWEEDEYNFFRERREQGTKDGFHGRDERFKGLTQ
jgi:enoyl-CoA hydratase